MPNVNDLKKSSFLKREDCGRGVLVTISKYEQINVAKDGAPEDLKWALHFDELEKPMVLNATNGQLIARVAGSDDFDHWIGKKVVLYDDPNVSFAGKIVGGIRVRAPKAGAVAAAAKSNPSPVSAPSTVWDEDVPF